ELPKAVQTVAGRHPDASFAIFEQRVDVIARQTVGRNIGVGSPLVCVKESSSGCDPGGSLTVADHASDCRRPEPHEWTREYVSISESPHSGVCRDQQRTVVAFLETGNYVLFTRDWKKLRSAWLPTPEPLPRACPEGAFAVLIERVRAVPKGAI